MRPLSRRDLLRTAAAAAALSLTAPLHGCAGRRARGGAIAAAGGLDPADPDQARLARWARDVRDAGLAGRDVPLGRAAARVGELAVGTPYVAYTLEEYLKAGGSPAAEPLTLSLTRFDCVSLVESCVAVARVARQAGTPEWADFGAEMERLRYRGGRRGGYTSRLHYFSDWIRDNAARGNVRDLGPELGGTIDARPLRFMTEHRASYPALADDTVFAEVGAQERALDAAPRYVVATSRIPEIESRLETGDILAFATSIAGLDVTHTAFAHRDASGVLRVLHAPLSGGAVEVTRSTLPEYVAAIRRSTGIMVARPLQG